MSLVAVRYLSSKACVCFCLPLVSPVVCGKFFPVGVGCQNFQACVQACVATSGDVQLLAEEHWHHCISF